MSQHEEDQQGGGQDIPPHGRGDNANPYVIQHQQQVTPNLDASAPQLKSNDLRRMNRNAIGMLAALAGMLVIGGGWILFSGNSQKETKPQAQREETVRVPEAPKAPPLPPAPPSAQPVVQQAIPLGPPFPQNNRNAAPTQASPREPTLLERRIAAAERGSAGVNVEDNVGQATPVAGCRKRVARSRRRSAGCVRRKWNPGHAMYGEAFDAVTLLDKQHQRASDERSTNLAAALAASARQHGLSHIDHVVLSDDGQRAYAVQGDLNSPFKRMAEVSTSEAIATSIARSTGAWNQATPLSVTASTQPSRDQGTQQTL